MPRTAKVFAFLCLLLLSATSAFCANENPADQRAAFNDSYTLTTDTSLAAEGYFVLSWTLGDIAASDASFSGEGAGEGEGEILLQQSADRDFTSTTDYPVRAGGSMTLTGFDDGSYYFRAGRPGDWSEVVEVRVAHHALSRALTIFVIGLVLFSILTAVILIGNRTIRSEYA